MTLRESVDTYIGGQMTLFTELDKARDLPPGLASERDAIAQAIRQRTRHAVVSLDADDHAPGGYRWAVSWRKGAA